MGQWKSLKMASGTGWKGIDRDAGTGWKALDWVSVPVDIGGPAVNYNSWVTAGWSMICNENPANASGTLTELDIFTNLVGDNVYVGTFYQVTGNTYKCRDGENIGSLALGLNNNVGCSLTVETGDYIGTYCALTNCVSRLYSGTGASYGLWYYAGNTCVADNETEYLCMGGNTSSRISLYGTG